MATETKLPKHWEVKKLGEVCSLVTDGTHKTPKYLDKGVPFISIANIQPFQPITFRKYTKFISQEEHELLSKRARAEKDDILFPRIGTLGYAKRIDWDYEVSIFVGLGLAKPNKEIILPKYLEYYMNTQEVNRFSIQNANGSGRMTLPLEASRVMPIPLPPLTEQVAIVSKIEELLSDLENGKQQLLTAQQQLKVYRQSLLKWAFEGKLTKKKLKDGELPKGWKWVKLGEVVENVEYGSATKSKKEGKVPVLRMGNIQNGKFDWDDLVYTDDKEEIEKYLLKKGDVLFNRTNSAEWVGKTAQYNSERPAIFAGYLIRINRIEKLIDATYLTYYLNTHAAKQYGNTVRSFGVNQSNINGTKLKTYPIPLPPLEEQQAIVEELEAKLTVCDKIEETISTSLQQAETLRQSILKRAFEGKLI